MSTKIHEADVDVDKIIDGLTKAGGGNCCGILRQFVENGVDAEAGRIDIWIEGRNTAEGRIWITDNGNGFSSEGISSFFSLLLSSKVDKGNIRQQGVIGQHGSGRLFALSLGGRLTVYTRSSDFPGLHTFFITKENLAKLLRREQFRFSSKEAVRPDWLMMERGHGSTVVISEIRDWRRVPTLKRIRTELTRYLSPSIAKKVWVNGEPLPKREILGEVIEETIAVDYLPGKQHLMLYAPAHRSPGEEVMLGGMNPICALLAFYKELEGADADMVPLSLLDRSVLGHILIPGLNEFRGPSSNELDPDFYQDKGARLRQAVLRFLHEEVGPRLRKLQGKKRSERDRERDREILEWVAGTFPVAPDPEVKGGSRGSAGGGSPPSKPGGNGGGRKKPRLKLNTYSVTLECGQNFQFEVDTGGTSGHFVWNASEAGGAIKSMGKAVKATYSAGEKPGRFTLKVYDKNNTELSAIIHIRIVEKGIVSITPLHVEVRQGEKQRLELLDPGGRIKNPQWTIEGGKGLSLRVHTGGKSADLSVDQEAELGERRVWVTGEDGNVLEAVVEVTEMPQGEGLYIRLEDRIYRVEVSSHALPDVAEAIPPARAKKWGRMKIDPRAPWLQQAKKGKMDLNPLITFILLAHLRQGGEEGAENTTHRLKELMSSLHEAKKPG